MPFLSSTRKAEQFARLLEGGGGGSDSGELGTLQQLATRLSAVPQPRPEFASALRDQLMSQATATLPSAGTGAAGAGGSGAGGSGAGGSGAGGSAGGAGVGAGSTGAASTGAAAMGPAASAPAASGSAASGAASAGAASAGSAFSAVMSATAPVWAQFAAITAATAIAIGGVGLGASQSLPGQPLYGVKRQIEMIQVDLAGGKTDAALEQLGDARTRLTEISDLLGDRAPGAPLPADLRKRIAGLLQSWASSTSDGTTALLEQLQAGSGDVAALRQKLVAFTDAQARGLALLVQRLPDATLQSYTGSAFAYLQRVDTALGNPVHLATLLPSVGLALPSATSPAATPSTGPSSATPGSAPTGSTGTPSNRATSVPTLPIPNNGSTSNEKSSQSPKVPSSSTLPSGGLPIPGGNAANQAVNGVNQTVDGVLNGVTGHGPRLNLPTSVPTVSRPTGH
jgi:hypothetical protein